MHEGKKKSKEGRYLKESPVCHGCPKIDPGAVLLNGVLGGAGAGWSRDRGQRP